MLNSVNPVMLRVYKIIKHTLKILQQMLHNFQGVYHFVDTRHCQIENEGTSIIEN